MRKMVCILLGLLLLCTSCASAPAEDVTAETVRTMIDAINAEDADTVLSLFSQDVRQADYTEDMVRRGLADFTDTLESFTLIGSETSDYKANGYTLYQTLSHYDLQGETAHYTLFVSLWHADGEVGYPNDVQMGVHTVRIIEDADRATEYDGLSDVTLDAGGFHYTPSRLYGLRTSYQGAFRVEDETGKVWLTNEHIQSAEAEWYVGADGVKFPMVQIRFTTEGTTLFAEATRRNLYNTLTMYIGDEQIAAPTVQTVINDGTVMLSGTELFPTYEDAEDLAIYFYTYEEE